MFLGWSYLTSTPKEPFYTASWKTRTYLVIFLMFIIHLCLFPVIFINNFQTAKDLKCKNWWISTCPREKPAMGKYSNEMSDSCSHCTQFWSIPFLEHKWRIIFPDDIGISQASSGSTKHTFTFKWKPGQVTQCSFLSWIILIHNFTTSQNRKKRIQPV